MLVSAIGTSLTISSNVIASGAIFKIPNRLDVGITLGSDIYRRGPAFMAKLISSGNSNCETVGI